VQVVLLDLLQLLMLLLQAEATAPVNVIDHKSLSPAVTTCGKKVFYVNLQQQRAWN
jgi:hypothetical protein